MNELIQLMGLQTLRLVMNDIRNAKWYSIIADETRDLSGQEQLTVCIRWVDTNYDVHEDFIGFVQVNTTDAETLTSTSTIKDILDLSNCVGQAYDGASNMSGRLNGVSKKSLSQNPNIYIYTLYGSLPQFMFTGQC